MYRALLWKEFREHWPLLAVTGVISLVIQTLLLENESAGMKNGKGAFVTLYFVAFLLPIFYIAVATAVSYAQEDEHKTAAFLRMLPITGKLLFTAKMSWVALGTFVLLLLAGPSFAVALKAFLVEPRFLPPDFPNAIMLVFFGLFVVEFWCWGLFWSTRWPKQVFAAMMGIASVAFIWGIIGVGLNIVIGNTERFAWLDAFAVLDVLRVIVIIPVAVLAVRGALRWNNRRDPVVRRTKTVQPPAARRDPQSMLLRRVRSPFAALLLQSIRQSAHLLGLGLVTALAVVVWLNLCWDALLADGYMEKGWLHLSVAIVWYVGGTILFLFSGSIFAEDFQNNAVRALTQRGVKPGLIWWSRILPFAAVYAIPLPWILWFLLLGEGPERINEISLKAAFAVFCFACGWYVPFAIASYLAAFLKGPIKTAAATALCTLVFGCFGAYSAEQFHGSVYPYPFVYPFVFLIPPVFALLFASRWQAESWGRERSALRAWRHNVLCLLLIFAPYLLTWGYMGIFFTFSS